MSLDPNKLNPGDIYRDAQGDIWVVQGVMMEPSVTMERIWKAGSHRQASEIRRAGVSGQLWDGFTKIAASTLVPRPELPGEAVDEPGGGQRQGRASRG